MNASKSSAERDLIDEEHQIGSLMFLCTQEKTIRAIRKRLITFWKGLMSAGVKPGRRGVS
jgi:hypothetical protein